MTFMVPDSTAVDVLASMNDPTKKILDQTRIASIESTIISCRGQIRTNERRKRIVDRRRKDILDSSSIIRSIKADIADAGESLGKGILGAAGPQAAAREMLDSADSAYDIGKTGDADQLGNESYRLSRKNGQLESELNTAEYDLKQERLEV